MGFADLNQVRAAIEANDLAGLLVVQPENFGYIAGVSPLMLGFWRRVGPCAAVVPKSGPISYIMLDAEGHPDRVKRLNPDARVITHTLWMEWVDTTGHDPTLSAEEIIAHATANRGIAQRPETYVTENFLGLVRSTLGDAGMLGKRIGMELTYAPAADLEQLRPYLDGATLVDSSKLFGELRLIKQPAEIDLLRLGAEITEVGINAAIARIDRDTTVLDLKTWCGEEMYREARRRNVFGFEAARPGVEAGPHIGGTGDPNRPLQPGDLFKFDSGVKILGYQSDLGRMYSFGEPGRPQKRIAEALLAGFAAGLAEMTPGRRFCDVFAAVERTVRKEGFPSYARGHFGHSLGAGINAEEWPWFSRTEQTVIAPGMVLAFEVPYYVNGIGSFTTEENLLITETGYESFVSLPIDLIRVEV